MKWITLNVVLISVNQVIRTLSNVTLQKGSQYIIERWKQTFEFSFQSNTWNTDYSRFTVHVHPYFFLVSKRCFEEVRCRLGCSSIECICVRSTFEQFLFHINISWLDLFTFSGIAVMISALSCLDGYSRTYVMRTWI